MTSTTLNLGVVAVSGFDIVGDLDLETGMGALNIKTNIAITDAYDVTEVVGFGTAECAGTWDGGGTCGGPTFELQTVTKATLSMQSGDLILTHRFLDEIEDQGPYNANIDSQNYIDGAYTTSFGDVTIYVGVNNIMDEEAPVLDDLSSNGNTFPSIYDAFGRYVFMNATYEF